MNYISYSLWGCDKIYLAGIVVNVELAEKIYPGWKTIVYHDSSVPIETILRLQQLGAITIDVTGDIYGMFWRFYAADLPDCNYVVFRDSDSRLSIREKMAVNEWMISNNALHIMRDHPYHQDPVNNIPHFILGGMWGIKGNVIEMKKMIKHYSLGRTLAYGSDQIFLNDVYHKLKTSIIIHDDFFSNKPFPIKRTGYRFIGERIDENENPASEDWKVIRNYYRDKNKIISLLKTIKEKIRSATSFLLKIK
ncbi:hypothetical protein ACTJKN_22485 [Pedobacter sp. 22163]|uniref:hypothetical protein n=1 Tax=Pedobacter sp. 22163 TaxID=3453883 RepID=UPI003F8428FD